MIRENNPFQNPISVMPQNQGLNAAAAPARPVPLQNPPSSQPPQLQLASQNAASTRAQAGFDPGAGLFNRINNTRPQDPESMGASLLRIVNALRASQQQAPPSVLDDIAEKLSALKDRLIELGSEAVESSSDDEATESDMVKFPSFGDESSEVQEAEAAEVQESTEPEAEAESSEIQEAESAETEAESEAGEVQESTASEAESETGPDEPPAAGGATAANEPNMTFRPDQNAQNSEFDALADYQLQVRKRIQRTLEQLANTQVFQNSETLREIRAKLSDI